MLNTLRRLITRNGRKDPGRSEMMTVFQKKYVNFKVLLESNAELLKIISGIEERLGGHHIFGMSYIRSEMSRLIFHAFRMVRSFEELSGRRYPELIDALNEIQSRTNQELELKNVPRVLDYLLPYTQVNREMVDFVGGKNANLGEIRSRVGLPVPRGFAITTTACDELIEFNDLLDDIRRLKLELNPKDPETFIRVSEEIRRMFPGAAVPPAMETAILEAYDREIDASGKKRVALRSSAVGEDTDLSFAGQYVSFLNVPRREIIGKFKEVIAGLFTPRAISYRLHMGISFEDVAMSVACVEMIDAKAGGVMYTRHPFEPGRNNIIINGVCGLGKHVVDGDVTPDEFELTRTEPPVLIKSEIVSKPNQLIIMADGTLADAPVAQGMQTVSCLGASQAAILAGYGMKLEQHFGSPQDIEWALDQEDNLIILQSRPLRIEGKTSSAMMARKYEGYDILLEEGSIASPGVGHGPAHIVRSEEDLLTFPEGGILVAPHPSPQYVIVMEKARAIVTNSGSITGHMASLAREFKVPAVLNTKTATSVIPQGAEITVDAFAGRVYAGKVSELLESDLQRGAFMKDTPVYETLRKLAQLIVPLNLTNPKSRRFAARNCKTIHDIMRFAHERSYGEVFQISDFTTDKGKISLKLDAPIPVDLYIIDLGGGLSLEGKASKVKPDQVTSAPFKALLHGLLDKELKPFEPRPVNLRGFLSVMSEQMLAPPNRMERFGDRSYAIISDKYLNFSSRVGYHYSILDSYCGRSAMKNYINFQFTGGAADNVRRNRRARLIQKVLEANGFLVEVQGDRVNARFGKQEGTVSAEKLAVLGRLLVFTRQMDMLMNHEDSVNTLAGRFLAGKYDFEGLL